MEAIRVSASDIADLREQHCLEMSAQMVRYAWLSRGFAVAYALRIDGQAVGYGLVGGSGNDPRKAVSEFFIIQEFRGSAQALFRQLLKATGAESIHAQTNDPLLSLMMAEFGCDVVTESILFCEGTTNRISPPGASACFREVLSSERDTMFPHKTEPVGNWGIELEGRIVATGGLLFHYNKPFADLYMEVDPAFRQRSVGSFLVQELKRTCRSLGREPAARCDARNVASRRCLERAGLRACAEMRISRVKPLTNVGSTDAQSGIRPSGT